MSNVHRIQPDVVAHTVCPDGHEDTVEAISPVVRGGEVVFAYWPSALEYCMECEAPIVDATVEVSR